MILACAHCQWTPVISQEIMTPDPSYLFTFQPDVTYTFVVTAEDGDPADQLVYTYPANDVFDPEYDANDFDDLSITVEAPVTIAIIPYIPFLVPGSSVTVEI